MGMSRRIMGEGVRWRGQGGCRLEGRAHSERRDLKVAISLAMHLREIGGDRSGGQAEVAGDDRKRSHAGHRAEEREVGRRSQEVGRRSHGWSKSPSAKRSFMICFCMFSCTKCCRSIFLRAKTCPGAVSSGRGLRGARVQSACKVGWGGKQRTSPEGLCRTSATLRPHGRRGEQVLGGGLIKV